MRPFLQQIFCNAADHSETKFIETIIYVDINLIYLYTFQKPDWCRNTQMQALHCHHLGAFPKQRPKEKQPCLNSHGNGIPGKPSRAWEVFPSGPEVKNPPAMQETQLGRSPGEGNSNPLQYFCLENPMERGAWRTTIHRVARVRHNLETTPPPLMP